MNRHRICIATSINIIIICLMLIVKSNEPLKDEQRESIDYSQYQNKTWVTENSLGEIGDSGAWSFNITKIENGFIEGEYTGTVAERRINPKYPYDKFSGGIIGDTAVCQFIGMPVSLDGVEAESKVILRFREDNRVLVSVAPSANGLESGDYLYCPYNIEDITFGYMLKRKKIFPIELDYGEEVSILSTVLSWEETKYGKTTEYFYPHVYLVNEKEDILYKFNASFQTNTEVTAAAAEDVNGDGLKDIRLTASYIGGEKQGERLLYQTESGGFYYNEKK